jgi:arylsulfatase A-like enzyme
VYPALLLALLGAWRITSLANAHDAEIPGRPHVILIGVDSLRPDAVAMGRSVGLTPNIDRFISESVHFEDAITPLARTFPSWMTMLTGRHPVETRVRENLLSPQDLNIPQTLAQVLQKNGYRTVYATDDVRCSNIDHRYGFDDIVGPKIGALDFLLGTINDLPLPNLVVNTWLGEWLFPYNYVNRASAVTYELDTFVDEVGSRVDFEQPTMLAVHLTLPHYPYYWARDNTGSLAAALRQPYLYSNSVIGADQQVGLLLDMLERKGALNNAIVVLLSDHGEALGLPGDNLLADRAAKEAARGVTVQMWGHGNSTLSPGQYQVVFSWKGYGKSDELVGRGRLDTPASLEDLMPTMLDVIGIPFDGSFDGLSLREEIVAGDAAPERLRDRVRYTETGITMGFTKLGDAKVDEIVQQGMSAYAINPENGRLELRREYFDELMRSKERAALGRTRILSAVPLPDGSTGYVVLPRDAGGMPLFLDGPPGADDPELSLLWQGLYARFGSELGPLDRS